MGDAAALREELLSGRAWRRFCAALAETGDLLLGPDAPADDLDRAEGYRHLTRLARLAFKVSIEHADPADPALMRYMDETQKFGIDNPDQDYFLARISGRHRYRLAGVRGSSLYLGVGIYAGSVARGGRRTVAHLNDTALPLDAAGHFELLLGPEGEPGVDVALPPDTTTLILRETFPSPERERPGRFRIECLSRPGPPPPLDPARVAAGLEQAVLHVRGSLAIFMDLARRWRQNPNRLHPRDDAMAEQSFGDPDLYYSGGYFRLEPDEALVFEWTPPPCRYWSLLLCNLWSESFDYRHHRIHANAHLARAREDGSVRLVVAHRDPGLPDATWLDTAGHREGLLCLRYLLAESAPIPQPARVPLADLAGGRP